MDTSTEPLDDTFIPRIKLEEPESPVVLVAERSLKRSASDLDLDLDEEEVQEPGTISKVRKPESYEAKELGTTPEIGKSEPEPNEVKDLSSIPHVEKVENIESDDEALSEGEFQVVNQYKLLVIHSDAIIDGREAVIYTITQVFSIMMPDFPSPSHSAILSALLSNGPLLVGIYEALGSPMRKSPVDMQNWLTRHKNIFQKKGLAMLRLYPEVREFFLDAHHNNLPILIQTNSGHSRLIDAIFKRHDKIDGSNESIMGKRWMILDEAYACAAKPDKIGKMFKDRVIPAYAVLERDVWRLNNPPEDGATMPNFGPMTSKDVFWISCAPYNLHLPKVGYGAKTCWVNRTEYGGGSLLDAVDVVASDLDDVRPRIWKEIKC
ncbi:hypothetical protein B0T25DRAFT_517812 [Lasiosphaeria hispida]|uniref:Uncharacterized protein n=1 Tax=Lasiosphaeria hispida TaxID=260671 RepID=A0AAJ0MDK7_9PEZI|nr:hypothetical protein B0T25DRAFT_517812 [Lasiosphaeria hispida]